MTTSSAAQQALIQVAKVLSNPVRLLMLEYLAKAKMAQCTSFTRMIGVPQPQTSRHLKKMLECGIVNKQFIGRAKIYLLNEEKWKVIEILLASC
jgi:DNA-binding transcriptional ArsR family regulator